MGLKVLPIKSKETYNWLLEKHYAKRIPNITDAFGLFFNSTLIGVVTYGIYFPPPFGGYASSPRYGHLSGLLLMVFHHLIAFVSGFVEKNIRIRL